jgi:REP element-mobilizing transposase RayT
MKNHGLQTCFLTFRTRGTWLHGDPRGSQDRYRNVYGTPLIPPTPVWQQEEAARLRHPPLTLDARMRRVVHDAIVDKCAWRGWPLHALQVRTAHVHVVLSCHCSPDDALEEIKGRCTRKLREAGLIAPDRKPWSHHGSTVHIYRQSQYEAVCRYVRDEQGPDLLSLEEIESRYGE